MRGNKACEYELALKQLPEIIVGIDVGSTLKGKDITLFFGAYR